MYNVKDFEYFGDIQLSFRINDKLKSLLDDIKKAERIDWDYLGDEAMRMFLESRNITNLPKLPKRPQLQ